jgi:hypothetical protein
MNKPVPKLPISSARSRVAAIKGIAYMPASGVCLMCTRDPDICLPYAPEAKWRLVTRVLNGIQLVSKCLLHQDLTQCTAWFCHEGEGFGSPFFDPGLDTVRPCGIDE